MTPWRNPRLRLATMVPAQPHLPALAGWVPAALGGWAALSAAATARADVAPPEDAAESRATSFQAVEGPTAEQVPGGTLLVAAYAVVLVLLVAYVGRLGSLQRKNQTELARLSAAVERARKG